MSTIPVHINIQNNFTSTATSVSLWHQFSSNPVTGPLVWTNIPANGGIAPNYYTVNGSTSAGHDYWKIIVSLSNGQTWQHTSWKTCTIETADYNNKDTFVVSPDYWHITLISGPCSTTLTNVGTPVAAGAELEPENKKAPTGAAQTPAKK